MDDVQRRAHCRLPAMVRAYVEGGADDLATVADNRAAFGRWQLLPRVLQGVNVPDLSTTVAGVEVSLPVLLAPTGLSGLAHWSGDLDCARAAHAAGTRYVLSTASSWSIEEVAGAAPTPPFFQLYAKSGRLTAELLERAAAADYPVLVVTVDAPVVGNREGERRTGMGRPPTLTPRQMLDMATHPRWSTRLLRHRRISARSLVNEAGLRAAVDAVAIQERELLQSTLCWDDLHWIRERWNGPLLVKGILRADDARRAVDLGCSGVIVSNHGGRQLDTVPASLDCLPAVVAEVGAEAEVLLDGGIRRGTDIIKALALGARAVLIGRPYLYGLAVSGQAGVTGVLDILRAELVRAMILTGVGSVSEIDSTVLRRSAG